MDLSSGDVIYPRSKVTDEGIKEDHQPYVIVGYRRPLVGELYLNPYSLENDEAGKAALIVMRQVVNNPHRSKWVVEPLDMKVEPEPDDPPESPEMIEI